MLLKFQLQNSAFKISALNFLFWKFIFNISAFKNSPLKSAFKSLKHWLWDKISDFRISDSKWLLGQNFLVAKQGEKFRRKKWPMKCYCIPLFGPWDCFMWYQFDLVIQVIAYHPVWVDIDWFKNCREIVSHQRTFRQPKAKS